jgi:hypothetical protein
MRHHTDTITIGRDFDWRASTGNVYVAGAFMLGDSELWTNSECPTGKALSLIHTPTPRLDLEASRAWPERRASLLRWGK